VYACLLEETRSQAAGGLTREQLLARQGATPMVQDYDPSETVGYRASACTAPVRGGVGISNATRCDGLRS